MSVAVMLVMLNNRAENKDCAAVIDFISVINAPVVQKCVRYIKQAVKMHLISPSLSSR